MDDLCYGDARYAAGLTLASLIANGGPEAYVAHWLELAGLADNAVFRFYVAAFLCDFMGEQGGVFNGKVVRGDAATITALGEAFEQAMRRI